MSTTPETPASPAEAVRTAAASEKLDGQEQTAALAWFLDPDPSEEAKDTIELNVGGPIGSGKEQWIPFGVQVVDRERIREIREESKRGSGDDADVNELEANLRIAVEGLINPDLSKAENRKVRGQQFLDPASALQARFAHKPGLIDQLAGAIVNLSGYNEKDVREVRATGN